MGSRCFMKYKNSIMILFLIEINAHFEPSLQYIWLSAGLHLQTKINARLKGHQQCIVPNKEPSMASPPITTIQPYLISYLTY